MLAAISKVRVWGRLYWPIGVGVIVAAVIAYAFWPLLVAIVVGIGALFTRRKSKSPPVKPAWQVESERRDTEIVLSAIEEHRLRGEEARAKANQAGAAAAVHGARASSSKGDWRNLPPEVRKSAWERAKAKARKGNGVPIVLAILLAASSARAEELLVHPDTGVEGWYLTHDEHLELQDWVLELIERRDQVADLQLQVRELGRAADYEATAAEMCTGTLRASMRRVEELDSQIDKLSAWYRSPRFVGPAAFVLGTLLVTTIVIAAD